jgi:hypothetical protein
MTHTSRLPRFRCPACDGCCTPVFRFEPDTVVTCHWCCRPAEIAEPGDVEQAAAYAADSITAAMYCLAAGLPLSTGALLADAARALRRALSPQET